MFDVKTVVRWPFPNHFSNMGAWKTEGKMCIFSDYKKYFCVRWRGGNNFHEMSITSNMQTFCISAVIAKHCPLFNEWMANSNADAILNRKKSILIIVHTQRDEDNATARREGERERAKETRKIFQRKEICANFLYVVLLKFIDRIGGFTANIHSRFNKAATKNDLNAITVGATDDRHTHSYTHTHTSELQDKNKWEIQIQLHMNGIALVVSTARRELRTRNRANLTNRRV